MAQKLSAAAVGPVQTRETQAPLGPNRGSEGLRLVKEALAEGRIVSTGGMSKDEYVAHLKSRKAE